MITRSTAPIVAALSALLALSTPTVAQVAYDSPAGRVEVLGLRRWTLDMLRDSVRHYVPGQELHDAACMVTLRERLGFVEASVARLDFTPAGGPERTYLTIKLLEPQESARVQYDVRPRDEFSSLLPDYAGIILPITDSTGGVFRGRVLYWLQASDSTARSRLMSYVPPAQRADGDRMFSFLDARRTESARQRAMTILQRDGLWANRMVAATILANFPARDSTWWALAKTLRDPHEAVRESAVAVLSAMPRRTVDWEPVAADLRLLLGGTNLPAIESLFEVLAATGVAPSLARPLLRDNSEWVLDHLGLQAPGASRAAHRLLVRLNGGTDLGPTRGAWAAWAARL